MPYYQVVSGAGRADVIDKTTRTAFGQRRARVRLKFSSGNGELPVNFSWNCVITRRNLIEFCDIHLKVNDSSNSKNDPTNTSNTEIAKKITRCFLNRKGPERFKSVAPAVLAPAATNSRVLRRFHPFFEAVGCEAIILHMLHGMGIFTCRHFPLFHLVPLFMWPFFHHFWSIKPYVRSIWVLDSP